MVEIFYFSFMFIPPLLIMGFILVGVISPRQYHLKESKILNAPMDKVWGAIRDFDTYPSWLSYASAMEVKESKDGRKSWLQTGNIISVEFEILEERAPQFLKMNQKSGGPVTGVREIHLKPGTGNETQVDVSQVGEIRDPIMRAYLIFFHYRKNPAKLFLDGLEQQVSRTLA